MVIYTDITGPKINRNNAGTLVSGTSVRVYPGTSLANYNAGNTTTEAVNGSVVTKGLPNKGLSGQDENQAFWRELRQPDWISPTLTINIVTNAVQLNWNKCTDPNPADSVCGYLIVRVPKDEITSATAPVDGINYSVGAKIGSATVIASINGSDKNSYFDATNFPCGSAFVFRVYAYKYSLDDQNLGNNPRNARGRSYNETSFAEKEIEKTGISKPTISSEGGITSICTGDSVKLNSSDNGGTYKYQWYVNNAIINAATTKTYTAKVSGNYQIEIYDASTGCSAKSSELTINVLDYPNLKLFVDNKEVKTNQTITICDGLSSNTKISGASSVQWYKNDVVYKAPVLENKTFPIYESGKYYAIANNGNLCADTTFIINLRVVKTNYTIAPTSLNFNLTSNDPYGEQTISVTNNSDDELIFDKIDNSTNFSVVSPTSPYTVPAHQTVLFTIRFNPSASMHFEEEILFYAPCDNGKAKVLTLIGDKEKSNISTNVNKIEFSNIVHCQAFSKDSTITITNSGSDQITINQPIVSSPFEVIESFPLFIPANDKIQITVRFNPSMLGDYISDLEIPYVINAESKSLKIRLSGSEVQPEYDYNYSDIVMQEFSDAVTSRDTFLIITNNGKIPVKFDEQPTSSEIHYNNIPLTINPSQTDTLLITVSPTATKSYSLSLDGLPCNIPGDYSINCIYASSEYLVSVDTLNLGKIIKCPNNVIRDSSFYIKVNGNPINPIITNISVPEGFIINKSNGDALTDSTNIIVTFIGNVVKEYKGDLSFIIMPNNLNKKVTLIADLVEPKLAFPDTLLFSSVELNTVATSTLQILNTTGMNVEVIDISSPNLPFNKSNIVLPQPISDGGELNVDFTTTVANFGIYLSEVTIRFRIQDCEFDSVITLKADVQNNSVQNAVLDVKNINAEVGSSFILPFYIDLKGADYKQVAVNGLSFDMSFNQTVYLPVSLYSEQRVDMTSAYIDDRGPGKVRVSMNFPAGTNMTDGKLFTIRSKALWGDANFTGIKIENIKIYAKSKLLVADDSATIRILNDCGYDNSLIGIDGNPLLKVSLIQSGVSIDYAIITDEPTRLIIYDIYGTEVFTKDISKKSGIYNQLIENNFNSGTYFVKFSNGNILKTEKFIIIR